MVRPGLFSVLLTLSLLGGCSKINTFGGGGGNMDAPILVSDELHIRHAHAKSNGLTDFQIQPGGQIVAFSDSGTEIKTIVCEKMTLTSGSSPDCTQAKGYDASGGKQWTLDVFASPDGSGTSLLTLTPVAMKPQCTTSSTFCIVNIKPNNSNTLNGTEDDGSDADTKGGTDLAVYDATYSAVNFASATLKDGSGNSATMKCSNSASARDCKIRIKFK